MPPIVDVPTPDLRGHGLHAFIGVAVAAAGFVIPFQVLECGFGSAALTCASAILAYGLTSSALGWPFPTIADLSDLARLRSPR